MKKIEDDISRAVRDKISPLDIKKHIASDPILSTISKNENRFTAMITSYVPDTVHEKEFFRFWEYNDFIYWKLTDLEDSVAIVGIAWDDDNCSYMFYARALPPE